MVLRWLTNCKLEKKDRISDELNLEELDEAEAWLIKRIQVVHFPEEYKALSNGTEVKTSSRILCLKPMLDENVLIRCDGGLKDTGVLIA